MENRDNEYPLFKTPKGKTIEVKPDEVYGLWIINPHSVNIPNYLKGCKYTEAQYACDAVTKWLDTLKDG